MRRLEGKVALVTGGGRGQGRTHALALAAEGASVFLCDIARDLSSVPYGLATEDDLRETVRLVSDAGGACRSAVCDVRDPAGLRAVVGEAVDTFGAVDVLVANAGICSFGEVATMSDQTWSEMIDVNLTGVFNSIRAVVPHMIERGSGRIVATSSMAARTGMRNLAHYTAAKWGIIGLVKSVALEVIAHGITANVVCPATVDTDMVHNAPMYRLFCPEQAEPTRESVAARYASTHPMPDVPWIPPEEISKAVLFLVSDDARYISGEVLEVAAGRSALKP